MSLPSGNRVPIMHITATFLYKGSSRPINSSEFTARLYDRDIFDDDFIEITHLTPEGVTKFTINPEVIRGWDSWLETKPDLYILLERLGEKVFSTPVAANLHINYTGEFDPDYGLHFDLGTYLVNIPEEE